MSFIDNLENCIKTGPHQKADFAGQCFCYNVYYCFRLGLHFKNDAGAGRPKDSQVSSPLSVFFGIIKGGVDAGVSGVIDSVNKLKQDYEPKQGE